MVDSDKSNELMSQIVSYPQSSFLIRLAEGDSLMTGVHVFQTLVNERSQNGVYISCNANSPYNFLENYFSAYNIDLSRVFFIDAVTNTLLDKKVSNKNNVVFTSGPIMRESLAKLKQFLSVNKNISFVYFDSLTELLKYHTEDEIQDFLANLMNLTKEKGMTGLVLSFHGEREANLVKSITKYCDHFLDL